MRQREKAVIERGAQHDKKDQTGAGGGLNQTVTKCAPIQTARHQGNDAGPCRPDRCALCRGEPAVVDATNH